ncbi:MAG: GNAT family N-acetyltransferase [Bacteroidia bacterium]
MNYGDPGKYKIITSNYNDMDTIFSFFDHAIKYQKRNGYDLWPQFSRELIENEIKENRNWKIMDGTNVVCVFSIMYNDPVIWKERDIEPAVYLHRIAVNPLFKGKGMMNIIKQWALKHARENKKHYLRMDTWGNNETLRNYYISCGFNYIGQQYLTEIKGQPLHYGGSVLSLFQIEV